MSEAIGDLYFEALKEAAAELWEREAARFGITAEDRKVEWTQNKAKEWIGRAIRKNPQIPFTIAHEALVQTMKAGIRRQG